MAETPTHLVLPRKWRPEQFSELVGQSHVTRTLSEALRRGRIAHAFLFTGIRGVGKTTAARILARCLNCEKGPTPEPCGECAACVEIRAGRALDVSEIDGATYRKIDDARAIIENLSYRPARDRFKIYIIDEAHQLTDQAFNALLKTLEEPPPHVKFILATTEPQKMPETILSRLQRYDFRRIPYATILERLKDLAHREEIEIEESALRLVAREAGGSMRDGERMLETAIATSAGKVTETEVASSLGVASRTAVLKITDAILDKNAAEALRGVRELANRGANLESLGRDLLETLRNLAIAKLPATDSQSALDDIPDHEVAELKRLAGRASARDIMRLFHLMAESQEQLIRSPYPDLLLEMAVVRMASLAAVIDADELLRAIGSSGAAPQSSSGGGSSGGSRGGAPPEPPAKEPASGTRRLRVEGEVKADAPLRKPLAPDSGARDLPELRDFIRSRRAALAGFMEQGAGLAIAGNLLTLSARNDIYIRYLNDNKSAIADLASEHFGRKIRVELSTEGLAFAASSGTGNRAPTTPTSSNESPREPERAAPAAMQASKAAIAPARSAESSQNRIDRLPLKKNNGIASAATNATAPLRAATPEEKQAVLTDPAVRRIFDSLDARLVELKVPTSNSSVAEKGGADIDSK
ncbi:MAG: DNA polymerase III subunit gamma/tau [Candidatus Binatus sp.]|uniref:DNA polymerase III subunit gamma/tau n=1 Tax=Candidatus Binatus sp. TaxID=2811406 RepID=UPI002723FCF9|nr:DNA polymerase III subunit gamma/tau [Candidatus Binatus sp.]MDO8432237.1 DNA polymerase III subunit gamma/tau [Candidatus Binatus sp.]